MNDKQFAGMLQGLEELEHAILDSKGKDYTQGDRDRLKNFKSLGRELIPALKSVFDRTIGEVKYVAKDPANQDKLDRLVSSFCLECPDHALVAAEWDEEALHKIGTMIAWWVYFRKHVDAMASYVCSGKVESEGLTGRINDIRNYAVLGAGLMVDYGDIPEFWIPTGYHLDMSPTPPKDDSGGGQ